MTEDRLTQLETTVAHQDQQIQELSDIVDRQWKDIERLTKRLDRLAAQLDEALAATGDTEAKSITDIAAANKPPHY